MEFTLRANFTYSTNKVNYYEEGDTKYEYTSATGRPNGYMKGYIALGLFKDQEETTIARNKISEVTCREISNIRM